MKRLLLAMLAIHNLAHAGVILVDESPAKKNANTEGAAVIAGSVTVAKQGATQDSARSVLPVDLTKRPGAPAKKVDLAEQVRTYSLKAADLNVRLALKRWLKEADMQLAYEAAEEFNVTVEGDYTGNMPDVLKKLMTSLKQTKYPLRACEYDNRVVLIVHRNEVCPLEDE
jgi:hypothetical protein